jgi:hypothetical protein
MAPVMHLPTPCFATVRVREGYDHAEVDAFVSGIHAELQRLSRPDPALAGRIAEARFTPRRLRRAYDMRSVDEHLEVLHQAASQGRFVS